MMVRALVAGGVAFLLAAQVVRNAVVTALADTDPATGSKAWPSHPEIQLSSGMTEIAVAAREGRSVGPDTFKAIYEASRKAPLAPEPFLVRGVQAQLSGDDPVAEQAFLQARWRDGRSLPARYFLAGHYLRQRNAARGLSEIAALARLVPDGVTKLAPHIARYASDRANQDQLRLLFRTEPTLEDSSLAILASDPGSADLVLALANPQRRSSKSAWLPGLLAALTFDRQYSKARQIWADLSGVRLDPRQLIYDPQFTRTAEPPPFNWALTSSVVGLAERQRGGGLHVIYYGQEDGPLASQLLVLPAGRYRLTTAAPPAAHAGSLSWALICAATNSPLATIPLDKAIGGAWNFTVPATCPAQRLELTGNSSETPEQVDVTVRGVMLRREPANG